MNERKFYDQPATNGCEFLGSHIRPYRIHLNNKTYANALLAIAKLNAAPYKDIDKMVQTFNSYSGLLKNRTDFKRLIDLRNKLGDIWWRWLKWDERRKCITYQPKYSQGERLNIKYQLNLKRYNNDTRRNPRAA